MGGKGELDGQVSSILTRTDAEVSSIRNDVPRTRKLSVQLSQGILERLEVATDRPGVGKSMVVEAALERFLDPAPPLEGLIHEALVRITSQIERLDSEIRVIAETVALHARYHLTVTPPMLPSQQREACALGHDRFIALAEQVDRRIRLGQPLMRETIARLGTTEPDGAQALNECSSLAKPQQFSQEDTWPSVVSEPSELPAAAREGGSILNFRQLPNAFC